MGRMKERFTRLQELLKTLENADRAQKEFILNGLTIEDVDMLKALVMKELNPCT